MKPLDKEHELIILRTNVQFEVQPMETANRFALMFETMAELIPDIRASNADPSQAIPDLRTILQGFTPLPHEAIFLGVANDGLPVLLNLRDPLPGPVLIVGDKGSGRSKLLKIIAQAVDQSHDPDDIRYVVIANDPSGWEGFDHSPNCEGVLSFNRTLTVNYIDSLMTWAHTNKQGKKFILLLVDGLEALSEDKDIHQTIRWLLLRGPSRRIWPIVTLDAAHIIEVNQWLDSFKTRLCGHMTREQNIQVLTGSPVSIFQDLLAGTQFAMRENKVWMPFWLPNLD